MNIKQRLQKWLEVPEKVEPPTISKEIQDTVDKLYSELDYWKRWFKSRQPARACTKCHQRIDLWPFNDIAYYIKGNRVTHQTCPTPLKDKKEKP